VKKCPRRSPSSAEPLLGLVSKRQVEHHGQDGGAYLIVLLARDTDVTSIWGGRRSEICTHTVHGARG
jgi:hypothetical protein